MLGIIDYYSVSVTKSQFINDTIDFAHERDFSISVRPLDNHGGNDSYVVVVAHQTQGIWVLPAPRPSELLLTFKPDQR